MLPYIDKWLLRWAVWTPSGGGFSSVSMTGKMMAEHAPTQKRKRRHAPHLEVITTDSQGNIVRARRDIDPMRCKETRIIRNVQTIRHLYPDDPACRAMDLAVLHQRKALRDVINTRYKIIPAPDPQLAAESLKISRTAYFEAINLAHEGIDSYLRAVFSVLYRKTLIELENSRV